MILIFSCICIEKNNLAVSFLKEAMISPTSEQYDVLQKQLKNRLEESHGETIYDIGIAQGKLDLRTRVLWE